jgi:folate-binding protein YgfZ
MSTHLPSPLRSLQDEAQASYLPYGPADGGIEIVDTFGAYQLEYAAIRKGVGILHTPQRGVVALGGADQLDFLHRFLTHDTRSLKPGEGRRAFLLSKAGRIIADLIVLHREDATLLVTDALGTAQLIQTLEPFVFTEEVTFAEQTEQYEQVSLHGPASLALLSALGGESSGDWRALEHRELPLRGGACRVYRHDITGSLGLHVLIPREQSAAVYGAMAAAVGGLTPDVDGGVRRAIHGRGIGWLAFNTARIEAGAPLFHIDFGPDSLPAETGLVDQAVSFTKGCYLGQEIVARMHNLGHPKRVLVGLKFNDDRLPIAGSQVYADAAGGDVVGGITSSALSPLLGNQAIALAVVKWGKHLANTTLHAAAEGKMSAGVVGPLRSVTIAG